MTRIIINNKSKLSDFDALERVQGVIQGGKVSRYYGTFGYCMASTFEDCYIECDLTRSGTHTFLLRDK